MNIIDEIIAGHVEKDVRSFMGLVGCYVSLASRAFRTVEAR